MPNGSPFRVIAERDFQLRGPDERTVSVRIGIPEPDPASPDNFRCPYQVTGLSDDSVKYAHGVDTLQALNLAFAGIRASVKTTASVLKAFHPDFSLTWEDTSWDVALPVWVYVDDEQRLGRLETFLHELWTPEPSDGEP
jgi:hypothetical protein